MELKRKRKTGGSAPDPVRAVLKAHERARGKVEIVGRVRIRNLVDLATYYTPGVAYVSSAIYANKDLSYKYTGRSNRIAILSDGSRILGLGNIGPYAGMPVMESKALLFKRFGNVDAIPFALNCKTTDEVVAVAKAIEPAIGGINIEDIAPPRCFEIVDRLQEELDIPVFHDDRHGTSVVVLAALKNALKLQNKNLKKARIVINGTGSAGIGVAQLLIAAGATDVTMCDRRGIVYKGRKEDMNYVKTAIAEHTNKRMLKGQLPDAVKGADVLIGLSAKGVFNSWLIKSMAEKSIVFALANPDPEITYDKAKAAGAGIVATGASNTINQVNNLLVFPAIFRGALDVGARKINMAMQLAASDALANSVSPRRLSTNFIIPNFVNSDMTEITADVSCAVARAAMKTGVSRARVDLNLMKKSVKTMLKRYSKIEKVVTRLDNKSLFKSLLGREN
jgi:malate dehydrogenase (oxaloacetate-decarboxylating)